MGRQNSLVRTPGANSHFGFGGLWKPSCSAETLFNQFFAPSMLSTTKTLERPDPPSRIPSGIGVGVPPHMHSLAAGSIASSSSASLPKREHTTTFKHRLLHLLDSPKSSIFQFNLTIGELSNVPQLDGEFSVSYKIRGRAPKGKDAMLLHNKPSLPNLRTIGIHPSTSNSSLRSTPTLSGSPLSGMSPIRPVNQLKPGLSPSPSIHSNNSGSNSRSKAATLAVTPPHPIAHRSPPQVLGKKASDPTPLRNHAEGDNLVPVESPEVMEEPEELSEADADPSRKNSSESRGAGSLDSGGTRSSPSRPLVSLNSSRANSANPSAASSMSSLSVPFPRSSLPPARSGTSASPATLIDSVPGHRNASLLPSPKSTRSTLLERRGVIAAVSPESSSSTLPRARTISVESQRSTSHSSSHRKGSTPVKMLKNHSCLWDYELSHVIKIPLSKAPPSLGSEATGRKPAGPILGSGPMSESGLQLIIYQHPTPAATTEAKDLRVPKDEPLSARIASTLESSAATEVKKVATAASGIKSVFGVVDLDLAAFAGKGRVTRRFLLRGSRTNAVVRLTIEMKWLGGESDWVA